MKVKIKYTDEKTKELYLKASNGKHDKPYKNYNSDFCYDCVATSCEEIAPNVFKYGLGFGLQIQRESIDDFNLSIDIRPRSSIYKTGLVLSNSQGTVDENYTNEISAVFYRVLPDMKIYNVGDRICQVKIGFTKPIDFIIVDELEDTDRGLGGFGSTGK